VKVLIVSTSKGFLDVEAGDDDTRARHELYLKHLQRLAPGAELRVLVLARDQAASSGWRPAGRLQAAVVGARSKVRAALGLLAMVVRAGGRLFSDWRPDLVTSQSPFEDGLFASLLAHRLGARHLAQAHFQLSHLGGRGLRKRLAAAVFARSQRIRFVSDVQRRAFLDAFGLPEARTFVAPVPMLAQTLARDPDPPAGERAPLCLYAGRFVAEKNLAAWIEVATRVAARLPEARFAMAGDGPLRSEVEAAVRARGLTDRFEFPGELPTTAMAALYRRAAVFLLTSRHDSFGRVVAEAAAFGVPVVSTRSGGPEEIIVAGETGRLRDQGDIDGLAADVGDLLADAALRTRMGEAARAHAHELYDADRLAGRLAAEWMRTVIDEAAA
jgi:glycosyltransferase involved in cell wall biosynthesis